MWRFLAGLALGAALCALFLPASRPRPPDHSPRAAAIYVHAATKYRWTNDPPEWILTALQDPEFKARALHELDRLDRIAPR